jgi:hypothetical protein
MQQVSDKTGVLGYFYADRVFDCPHRGQSMCVRSDAAGALYEVMCVTGISALKDKLDSPEHLPGTPGIFYLAPLNFDLDAKVTFNACDRINRNSFCHMSPPFFLKRIVCR